MLTNKDPPPHPRVEMKRTKKHGGGAEGEGKFKDLILGLSRSDVYVR